MFNKKRGLYIHHHAPSVLHFLIFLLWSRVPFKCVRVCVRDARARVCRAVVNIGLLMGVTTYKFEVLCCRSFRVFCNKTFVYWRISSLTCYFPHTLHSAKMFRTWFSGLTEMHLFVFFPNRSYTLIFDLWNLWSMEWWNLCEFVKQLANGNRLSERWNALLSF